MLELKGITKKYQVFPAVNRVSEEKPDPVMISLISYE